MTAPRLITDNLDLWTAAVTPKANNGRGNNGQPVLTGIKKLRELILELAVRGKLVPQDPTDEPAATLLEKIAAEKSRLVKEGKIKKPKPLPPVGEGEQPFALPEGWEWTTLPAVASYSPGKTPSTKSPKYWTDQNHGFPWASIADMTHYGVINKTAKHVSAEAAKGVFKGDPVKPGTILMSFKLTVGKVSINEIPLYHNEAIISLTPFPGVVREYLFKILPKRALAGNTKGAIKGNTLNAGSLAQILIPLPPLAEQHRIVEKVDELMALCDRLEQQTNDQLAAHETLVATLLDTLTRSADATELAANWTRLQTHFDTLFTTESSIDRLKQTILELTARGRLVDYPSSKTVPLKQVLSFGPRNGLSPKPAEYNTGTKVLKLGATTTGKLLLEESKNVVIDEPASSHLWLKAGDILIQRGNTAAYVGSNVLVTEDLDGFIYPDLMMKIRPNSAVDGQFLSIILSAPVSRKFMWDRMTGTSGTMPKISKKVVESIPILVPNFECQKRVVRKVGKLMAICDQLKVRLNHLRQTQQCLTETVAVQTLA